MNSKLRANPDFTTTGLRSTAAIAVKNAMVLGVLSIAVSLSGCGQVAVFGHTIGEQQTAMQASPAATESTAAIARKVGAVALAFTVDAKAQTASDPHFNADALLAAIKAELKSRNALDESNSPVTAQIEVDGYSLTPISNAILFGNVINTGALQGVLRAQEARTVETNSTETKAIEAKTIDAKARISISVSGANDGALQPLYAEFARKVTDAVTETVTRPPSDDSWRPR